MFMSRTALRAALIVSLGLAASPLWAHAILENSSPAEGAKVSTGILPIALKYNSKLDQIRSLLKLIGPDRQPVTLKIDLKAPTNQLATQAKLDKPGAYDLHWQALAQDGHLTLGNIHFTAAKP